MDVGELKNKKIAFVMSGGVVKAASWHLGVALALEELGFIFLGPNVSPTTQGPPIISTLVGSSAGAMIGVYFTAGHSARNVINATLGLKEEFLAPIRYKHMLRPNIGRSKPHRPDFSHSLKEFPSLLRGVLSPLLGINGFFTTEGIRDYLLDSVLKDKTSFKDYPADLFIVGTQLDSTRKIIFSKYHYPSPVQDPYTHYYSGVPLADAAAASMSVPPFYAPYALFNKEKGMTEYYIDGEIRDTLSSHVALDHGCDVIISSWTHTPYQFHDEVGSLAHYGLPVICIQAIHLMIQKKIIADRARRSMAQNVLDTVSEYLKDEKFPENKRKDLLDILQLKLEIKKKVRWIDIYPHPEDYKLFFASSFSLSRSMTSTAMKSGYRRAMEVFKAAPQDIGL